MADNLGPNNVYANIPRLDSHGRPQLPMFMRWNSDPVGNDASNLAAVQPDMQRVVNRARADNPNLNFVIGNGRRTAADQDWAKSVGWSRVGSQDGGDALVHMNGQAVDLWGLDGKGRVQFNPDQQKQISQTMKTAAQEEGVGINWGGDWKTFKDAPHFELAGGGSAAASGAPESPAIATGAAPTQPTTPSQPAQGTTLNSNVIDTLGHNISSIETGGFKNPYGAINPTTHAVGKYQVMPNNVGPWTQQALGQAMTPEEFAANPQAQEAVFRDQANRILATNSPVDFASIWFTGKPYNVAGGAVTDANKTTNASYVTRATAGIPNAGTVVAGNTLNTTGGPSTGAQTGSPTGAPGAGVGGVASTPGTSSTGQPSGALAGSLPGFTPNSAGAKMTSAGLQSLAGGQDGGQSQPPPPIPTDPAAPSSPASGGPMMLGPGGQNTFGQRAAQQQLLQQGFMLQPSLAANANYPTQSPVPSTAGSTLSAEPIGAATGMPGLPGTTLNSPSQLQMALMTGAMNPYDLYANRSM